MNDITKMEKIKMNCPMCDKEHTVEKRSRLARTIIKGEEICYKEIYYYCENSDEDENEFAPGKIVNENLLSAKDAYREKMGLLTSNQIKQIREIYKLSQSDLSNLLGWGEITITRYETKAIQDEAYDTILKDIRNNPLVALQYLDKNSKNFSENKLDTIRHNIIEKLNEYGKEYLKRQVLMSDYVDYLSPSDYNGNKSLDIDKLECIATYLAKRIKNLYKVKLMKLLWYADVLSYILNGSAMTGLVYQHEDLGALPMGHYKLLELENINVEKTETDNCTMYHILPNEKIGISLLDSSELDILDKVINYFKEFSSQDIIEYMHKESAYMETTQNQIIPFSLAKDIREF
jgi:putative zinc finger/helix-turn-helix YgiT family protein